MFTLKVDLLYHHQRIPIYWSLHFSAWKREVKGLYYLSTSAANQADRVGTQIPREALKDADCCDLPISFPRDVVVTLTKLCFPPFDKICAKVRRCCVFRSVIN